MWKTLLVLKCLLDPKTDDDDMEDNDFDENDSDNCRRSQCIVITVINSNDCYCVDEKHNDESNKKKHDHLYNLKFVPISFLNECITKCLIRNNFCRTNLWT